MTTAGVAHRRYSKDAGNPMRCDDWFRSYDEKTCTNAAIGSEQLRDACKRLFWKFELEHRFPAGFGEKLQLGGYK